MKTSKPTRLSRNDCVYCSWPTECWDHVIPWSWNNYGKRRKSAKFDPDTVPACNMCNGFASDYKPKNFRDKAQFILLKYEKKFPFETSRQPIPVTREEEQELDYKLLTFRKERYIRHCVIKAKYLYLRKVCAGHRNPKIYEEVYETVRQGQVRLLYTEFHIKDPMGKVLWGGVQK